MCGDCVRWVGTMGVGYNYLELSTFSKDSFPTNLSTHFNFHTLCSILTNKCGVCLVGKYAAFESNLILCF